MLRLRIVCLLSTVAATAFAQNPGEWPNYHRDLAGTRYSPLDQINRDNVAKLAVAWKWTTDSTDGQPESKNENTPIVVGGVMYFTSGNHRAVVAVDAATGAEKWRWRWDDTPARFAAAPRKGGGRGVSFWTDGRESRVFVVLPGFHLVALNSADGKPVATFGTNGFVDLKIANGAPMNLDSADIGSSSPPLVFENTVVVGPAHKEGTRPPSMKNVPGRVLAFDAKTGALKWRFNTVPSKGDFGYDTWLDGSAEFTGNTGVWAPMSLDTKRGYLYLPVEDATGDYYGGHRPGDNLFSASLVCLDVRTGKRVWHYQIVHHDIWDRDNPTAPILADITVDGRRIEAVAQITKQSFVYVFDRVTGKPVWPINETPVPQSDVPGEKTSPTQPIPSKPPAFDVQGITTNDLIDFTPELRAKAVEAVKNYRLGQLFSPPSLARAADGTRGTLSAPGSTGGANWEHGSFDPETGILYVGSYTNPANFSLAQDTLRSDMRYVGQLGGVPSVDGLPFLKPPYNRITAIDLNKGEKLWTIAGGDTPDNIKNNPALAGLSIPRTGARARPSTLATKTLLFVSEGWATKPVLHVHDKKTGDLIADIPLAGWVAGSPMSYMINGTQYVAFWVGKGGMAAELTVMKVGS